MIVRKLIQHGVAWGCTFPPPFMHEAGLHPHDLLSMELGRNNEIIIKRVDLKALAAYRKANDKARK